MADSIIVTMYDRESKQAFDLEVPSHLEMNQLLKDIIQTLAGYDPKLFREQGEAQLRNSRTGEILRMDTDLYSQGIWNGDYLYLERTEE